MAFDTALPSRSTTATGMREGFLRRTAQHCAEEGGDEDRRGKSHHERAAIGKVGDEVLLHEGGEASMVNP